ncbi:MAG TPA: hypothetical protein VII90_10590, partial [Anaerolineales bacterium]
MKKTTRTSILAGFMLAIYLGACVLPAPVSPTLFAFPTPNLTITALFHNPATPTALQSANPQSQGGGTASSAPSSTISPTAPDCANGAMFV